MTTKKPKKLWGGRFQKGLHPAAEHFTSSIQFDYRLAQCDIQGSLAWAEALRRTKLLTAQEHRHITKGLHSIGKSLAAHTFPLDRSREDIHMAIETALIKKIGKAGEKLHTGRSRNDQVATDLRLFLKTELPLTRELLTGVQTTLLYLGVKHIHVILPGYTHLQHAQPVLFAHHMLAYFEMLERDKARLQDAQTRVDVLPLGSGALAGSGYPIDRKALAKSLGFSQISENSLDAVSDRDFVVETLSALALGMTHLSRLAEELILWNSSEFSFIELPDDFATGSSMMPQKKNPDILELIRGKTGRVVGALMSLLTTLKGLPLTYNRDLQEDKEGLFDALDTYQGSLEILMPLLPNLKVNEAAIAVQLASGYLAATDLADYLVKKGVSFRTAHHIIGSLTQYAIAAHKQLAELDLKTFKRFSKHFRQDLYQHLSPWRAIENRNVIGGTAPAQVRAALARARKKLNQR